MIFNCFYIYVKHCICSFMHLPLIATEHKEENTHAKQLIRSIIWILNLIFFSSIYSKMNKQPNIYEIRLQKKKNFFFGLHCRQRICKFQWKIWKKEKKKTNRVYELWDMNKEKNLTSFVYILNSYFLCSYCVTTAATNNRSWFFILLFVLRNIVHNTRSI